MGKSHQSLKISKLEGHQDDVKPNIFKCEVCEVELTSEVDLKNHIGGKKHQSKLASVKMLPRVSSSTQPSSSQRRTDYECQLCQIPMTGEEALKAHNAGKKHQAKLASAILEPPLQSWASNKASSSPSSAENNFDCELCQISMTGDEDLRAHNAGKKHQAKLAAANCKASSSSQSSPFHCLLCGLTLTGPVDLENHKAGKSHQAKLTSGQASKEDPGRQCQKPSLPSSDLRCDLCDVKFTGDVDLRAHMDGKKHKAKLGAARG